jgi:hypothetical protein
MSEGESVVRSNSAGLAADNILFCKEGLLAKCGANSITFSGSKRIVTDVADGGFESLGVQVSSCASDSLWFRH